MKIRAVLAVPALVIGLVVVPAGSAAAETALPAPEIAWVNQNVVAADGGESARLLVKYRCWGEGVHLWGSAKQGPDLSPSQTGSNAADSWRETPEGPVPTCNGKWQTDRIALIDTPDTVHHDPLTSGRAWVQFVIFTVDSFDDFDPETGEGVRRAAWSGWRDVRGNTAG